MKKPDKRLVACAVTGLLVLTSGLVPAEATSQMTELSAGVDQVLTEATQIEDTESENAEVVIASSMTTIDEDIIVTPDMLDVRFDEITLEDMLFPISMQNTQIYVATTEEIVKAPIVILSSPLPQNYSTITLSPEARMAAAAAADEDELKPLSILIADVNDYVNVRMEPTTDSEIVGKLYDGCVGVVIAEINGWCRISSGTVTGYVSADYCITGAEADALYDDVVQTLAVVHADGLNVRSEASTDSSVLKVIPSGGTANVLGIEGDWVKVVAGTKEGYVSKEYVTIEQRYDTAESLEEEQARKEAEQAALAAQQAAERRAAEQLAAEREAELAAQQQAAQAGEQETVPQAPSTEITADSTSYEMGLAVAEYALQFEGNPYVYGGVSLTNGADCSGFVLAVYKNFGVALPHSANADQKEGYAVDGIENAQPGDLICYSGHVGIYIGNGQIIHASTSRTGIKISNAGYKTILAVRRIF